MLDSGTAYLNGKPYPLDVPAQLIQDATYVPVRFVAEALGASISWEPSARLVVINTETPAKPLSEA
ncbi:copper amine oxidase N-terminal domain-containing protein [Paenibacillus tyrfis]|uniref:copper amine oxidase N-terminal domain-containing protein n=1 Tax=Paenibacillus tyrfis TaxID=1501230 RepID=UPI00209F3673|nr:copper amine oxidase N-terminal domain-containing protein [Paenibacillus tyrfis]MCP1306156.1 copper amine oxidase N-terminal domain-containing protein [Paenibacillus tyrfis]